MAHPTDDLLKEFDLWREENYTTEWNEREYARAAFLAGYNLAVVKVLN